ncbi:ribonuclease P protein component [Mycoplasma miroungirhinis]|uniref:Ribonuclease P protein component n=1 Tax=Mycoplasma miroungirhinis TaxID=754516 RepID=A0A6M4JDX8_9MOLU|nr:ribonuclease P protein component [Mycoplasma miroungirhinis]QJR44286.1 ribonuclease P protein component [Mycoplasma miroungirhinis]
MTKLNVVQKNWEFQKIINAKKQFVSKNVIIYYLPSPIFKVGISIPKTFANAVLRNKYKNQIRQIIRKNNFEDILIQSVIIIRKPFFNLDFSSKEKEIQKIYERIRSAQKNKI